jgi:PilZ domain
VRMNQTLRVRPAEPKDGKFEEIGATKDVSQDGVYFVTERDVYRKGMRLVVTVPYHSPTSRQNYEYVGQVARVDELGNSQRGVAVRFLSSAAKKSLRF